MKQIKGNRPLRESNVRERADCAEKALSGAVEASVTAGICLDITGF